MHSDRSFVCNLARSRRFPPPSVRLPCLLSASFSPSSLSLSLSLPRSVLCPQYVCPSAALQPQRPSPHTRLRRRAAAVPFSLPQHNAGFLAKTSCLHVNNLPANSACGIIRRKYTGTVLETDRQSERELFIFPARVNKMSAAECTQHREAAVGGGRGGEGGKQARRGGGGRRPFQL